ncbi:MAG: DUF938 domain-containing protein [Myxococcota bacterium]
MTHHDKQFAPAAERNSQAIVQILRQVMPEAGLVLETASGTGQHVVYFAGQFPDLDWQPSDLEPHSLASIRAWRAEAGLANLRAPVVLDVLSADWPIDRVAAVLNINMLHISPWETCAGLMRGAGRVLSAGGVLYMYGPYRVPGRPTAPSNESFDAALRRRDPRWGLRSLDEVTAVAAESGLDLEQTWDMPANNLSLLFRRQ